ncbi:glycosyltransferase [Silvanigrella paludirubra]|uniref:Glycosyltransferase n=1 Tax=Silvanigrella paludirubra TaxID=2499159 RepID=A0A6N6VQA3_9BACT|nr:glycosyltransferase family 2 protein [Silvanigrella paludirubra]KAB8036832.1 glycosyltransferase [Silvanigrella paludirubra]
MNLNDLVSICIVNWNSGDLLNNCLKSISNQTPNIEVIIFDNASSDKSIINIENKFPTLDLKIIKSDLNLGFGKACNILSKNSSKPYILFLNPDTEINKNALTKPIQFLLNNQNVAVCGIMLLNNANEVSRSCARFPKFLNLIFTSLGLNKLSGKLFKSFHMHEWDHKTSSYVDHVIGAFYLIKKDIFEKLQGFDEDYFLYFEDLDLSKRVQKSGYKIFYMTDACAFHIGGGTTDKIRDKRLYLSIKSKLLYSKKHLFKIEYFTVLFFTLTVEFLVRILILALTLKYKEVIHTIRGYKMLYRDFIKAFYFRFIKNEK